MSAIPMNRVHMLAAHLSPSPPAAASSVTPIPTAAASSSSATCPGRDEVWIVGFARTPVGSGPVGGCFAGLTAPALGAIAMREAVRRSGVRPDQIEEVFFGNVLTAGIGQAPARQAALAAGLPLSTPCTTLNKVCASAMKALMLGTDAIRAGSRECVLVGGQESMSNAPFLLQDTRNGKGLKFGDSIAKDGLIHDGLMDAYHNGVHMGTAAELTAQKLGITREAQDAYAKQSYERAQDAQKNGRFAKEIVAVEIKGKDGKPVKITEDQEIFRAQFDRFSKLKPTFPTTVKGVSAAGVPAPVGTVTAANSSTIGDGAAALVLMSASRAKALGIKGLAVVVSHADAALAPLDYSVAPEAACRIAIKKAGLNGPDAVDIWELNEAFSVVALANMKLLGIPANKINLNGGSVSIGHPIGCSGARIICTLMSVLEQQNKSVGCAALCNGGGGASAVVIRRL